MTYMQTAHRETQLVLYGILIYLISIHDNLHLNSTQRHNMF